MDTFDYINDPLTAEQMSTLAALLQDQWTEKARDGFLVISGRFIDETGTDRTDELGPLFHTDTPQGRLSLRLSLETLFDAVGSLEKFEAGYPVYITIPCMALSVSSRNCPLLEYKRSNQTSTGFSIQTPSSTEAQSSYVITSHARESSQ